MAQFLFVGGFLGLMYLLRKTSEAQPAVAIASTSPVLTPAAVVAPIIPPGEMEYQEYMLNQDAVSSLAISTVGDPNPYANNTNARQEVEAEISANNASLVGQEIRAE